MFKTKKVKQLEKENEFLKAYLQRMLSKAGEMSHRWRDFEAAKDKNYYKDLSSMLLTLIKEALEANGKNCNS